MTEHMPVPLNQLLCWQPEELELLAMFAIDAKGRLAGAGSNEDFASASATDEERGGSDARENLRWTCREVNRAKRNMTDDELVALCGNVMRWIGMRIAAVERVT